MWWPSALCATLRPAFLAGALALTGCGFAPVYGPGSDATALRGAIALTVPESVEGYRLLGSLQTRLGGVATPVYHLAVELDISQSSSAIGPGGIISRYSVEGQAQYRLTDLSSETLISEGQVTAMTGYGSGGNTVAIRAAEVDARERLVEILAERIVTRLSALDLDP